MACNENLIVSFAGLGLVYGSIPITEFKRTLNESLPFGWDCDFYVDTTKRFYINGIPSISNDFETTLEYLKTKIEKYKKVVFIGASAGGYAATLFGSLLNIDTVISFYGLTILNKTFHFKYSDLKPIINNTTKYFLYGDTSDTSYEHNISHQLRIGDSHNIKIVGIPGLCGLLPKMRDNKELHKIIIECCKD